MYEYLKSVKSNVHLALEKAKHGGKKAPKGGKAAPATAVENCAVFVAPEYPDWQRQVLEILAKLQWEGDKLVGNAYVNAIKEQITGPKAGLAMKFAAFVIKEAPSVGKESALELKTPFNETELLERTQDFVFENMPGLKGVRILNAAAEDDGIEGTKNSKEAALPSKPSIFFY